MRIHGYLAFVLGACMTAVMCLVVLDAQDARISGAFARDSETVAADTRARLQTYFDVLLGIKGLFVVNGDIDRAQFTRFVRELKLVQRYPGFQAIQFVRYVPDDGEHFVIEYTEPMRGNEKAFMLDLGALPAHRAALQEGRDSGQLIATGRITLVQDASGQAGFVARLPVYRRDAPLDTVAERRAAFVGAVAIVFRVDSLMREVLTPSLLEHMALRIHDAGRIDAGAPLAAGADNVLFESRMAVAGSGPALSTRSQIQVAQRQWVLETRALAGSRYRRDLRPVFAVGAGGLLVSALICALLLGSRRRHMLTGRLRATLDEQRAGLEELERQKAQVELAHSDLSQVLATLKQTQAHLITSEKMASLGALVAGVAHELNTPIGNSLLTATTLVDIISEFEKQYADGALKRSTLETHLRESRLACNIMVSSLRRAADLIASFKQVAVDQTMDIRRRFDLCEVVRDTLVTYVAQLRRANCVTELKAPPCLMLDSYPGSVGQVISNLINNALLHAFEGRAGGRIEIGVIEIGDDQVQIDFNDDGVGMPAKVLRQVFDPFFSTKMGQGGSGLGMNIVYNIVTVVLGGSIGIESTPQSGTRITIRMPLSAPGRELRHDAQVETLAD
jgi:signal transduction histidine kinase